MTLPAARPPRTATEAACYNQGVLDVLERADEASRLIEASTKRHVHEAFAVAALDELAQAGMDLLRLPPDESAAVALPTEPLPASPSAGAELEAVT